MVQVAGGKVGLPTPVPTVEAVAVQVVVPEREELVE